jgi:hypothetical protein
MSTDTFEDELRSLLHHTADNEATALGDVDPKTVLLQGHRVVRRRRVATGAAIGAATVVVGLVGYSALSTGADRTTTPAGPTRVVVGTGAAVTAELVSPGTAGPEGGNPVPAQKVRVTIDRARGAVRYETVVDGEMTVVASGQLPSTPRASTYTSSPLVEGLTMGLVPESATQLALVWGGDAPGSAQATAPLPGTGFQAFAVWHTGAPSETTFAGFDWTDGEFVYRPDGGPVTSGGSGGTVAFVDIDQNLFGLFDADGTVGTKRLADTPEGGRPVMMLGQQDDGSDVMAATVLVVLPAGATAIEVTPRAGATLGSTEVFNGGSVAETLVVARLSMPQEVAGTGVQRVRWTGADGKVRTSRVGF